MFRRFSQIAALLLILSAALPINASLALEKMGDTKQAAIAARLPPNYRVLMARYMLTQNIGRARDAFISRPYERFGGILHGGTVPMVCVTLIFQNIFGGETRDVWSLTIQNGSVERFEAGTAEVYGGICRDATPFTELKLGLGARR